MSPWKTRQEQLYRESTPVDRAMQRLLAERRRNILKLNTHAAHSQEQPATPGPATGSSEGAEVPNSLEESFAWRRDSGDSVLDYEDRFLVRYATFVWSIIRAVSDKLDKLSAPAKGALFAVGALLLILSVLSPPGHDATPAARPEAAIAWEVPKPGSVAEALLDSFVQGVSDAFASTCDGVVAPGQTRLQCLAAALRDHGPAKNHPGFAAYLNSASENDDHPGGLFEAGAAAVRGLGARYAGVHAMAELAAATHSRLVRLQGSHNRSAASSAREKDALSRLEAANRLAAWSIGKHARQPAPDLPTLRRWAAWKDACRLLHGWAQAARPARDAVEREQHHVAAHRARWRRDAEPLARRREAAFYAAERAVRDHWDGCCVDVGRVPGSLLHRFFLPPALAPGALTDRGRAAERHEELLRELAAAFRAMETARAFVNGTTALLAAGLETLDVLDAGLDAIVSSDDAYCPAGGVPGDELEWWAWIRPLDGAGRLPATAAGTVHDLLAGWAETSLSVHLWTRTHSRWFRDVAAGKQVPGWREFCSSNPVEACSGRNKTVSWRTCEWRGLWPVEDRLDVPAATRKEWIEKLERGV